MNGLFLGLIGGAVASLATIIGALLIFFEDYFNRDSLKKIRLDFFVGALLIITAVSLLYSTTVERNINLVIAAFFLGGLILIFSKRIIKNILESIVINNVKEQKKILFILVFMLKNVPLGLAAGASMHLSHGGVGNSLLTAIAIHNLFYGTAVAFCFLSLGLDPLMAIMGAMGGGIIVVVAGLFGGYLSQESVSALSLIMAFAGGALMSTYMQEAFNFAIRERRKLLLNPSHVSVIMVMLIFIVWKELL